MTFSKEESLFEQQKRFLAYAAPTCMLIVSPFGLSFFTIMFAGWENKELLSGVALGNTTYNIFMMSFMCGFCSLLSTYGPQVYGSTNSRKQLGTVLQKVFIISFTVYLTVLAPYMKSLRIISWVIETVTEQLGKHHIIEYGNSSSEDSLDNFRSIQATAEEFIHCSWSWGLLDFTMRLMTKYLSLQYHSAAVYICTGLLMALHIIFSYLFTVRLGMGLHGLIMGGSLSRAISLTALLLYCCYNKKRLAWAGFTTKILDNWKEMMILGFSASVNVFSEMGMYELAIFLSQFRGLNYLATVVISFQLITLIYSTTYGVCYASSAMIGTALGEGDEPKIRRYMRLCLGNTIVESVFLAVLAYFYRYQLVSLFTDDVSVIQETGDMLWILLIEVPLDHIQTLFSYGILVTVGSQVFVASALAVICYGICTPAIVGFIFFTDLDGIGALFGMLLFVSLSCIVCGSRILRLDIEKEIRKVQVRVESSINPKSPEEQAALINDVEIDDTDESLLEGGTRALIITSNATTENMSTSRYDLKNNIVKVLVIFTLLVGWMVYALPYL